MGQETAAPKGASVILDAAVQMIQQQGWKSFSLNNLAQQMGLPLGDIYALFPTKYLLLSALSHRIDQETLQRLTPDLDATTSDPDRLLDVLMARFEAAAPYKGAIQKLWEETWQDPLSYTTLIPLGFHSMVLLLDAAQVQKPGIRGMAQAKVFGVLYLALVRHWLTLEGDNPPAFMHHLDEMIRKYGKYVLC